MTIVQTPVGGALPAAIRAYAMRFHAAVGSGHHVASPLGAWLLLALCAPASTGRLREELEAVLGMDVDTAFSHASHLIDRQHPAVSAALGAWTAAEPGTEGLARWLSQLPVRTARGPMPSQAELDAWVRRESRGILQDSPARVDSLLALLLVSVLATKVEWAQPLDITRATKLGSSSEWSQRVTHVLRSHDRDVHTQLIVSTDRIGDVAVHIAKARDGLDVVSVIADAEVAPIDVLDAAHGIAMTAAIDEPLARRSLYDLPLGETPRWTITEDEICDETPGAQLESHIAVLPAWSATSTHDLVDPGLGFGTVAGALREFLAVPAAAWAASQTVRARYSRTGFQAAAATGFYLLGSRLPTPAPRARLRSAELRFCHPYAAVAVVRVGEDYDMAERGMVPRAWGGLPVFSAWVEEPEEATERE